MATRMRLGPAALETDRSCALTTQRTDKRNERRSRRVLREGGTEWKVAATIMHYDVLLDSEECHECEAD